MNREELAKPPVLLFQLTGTRCSRISIGLMKFQPQRLRTVLG
jgi:hypothetical protein